MSKCSYQYCGYCGPVACKHLRGDNMRVSCIICECQSWGFVWMEDKTKQAYWIGQSGPIELLSVELTKSCSKMK